MAEKSIKAAQVQTLVNKIKELFFAKADAQSVGYMGDTQEVDSLVPDTTPTSQSSNLVTSGGVFTALSGKYAKPSTGIPSTDLASSVQTSLGKADAAYQKPSSGIPASDLASGVIPSVPTISTSITKNSLNTEVAGALAAYNVANVPITNDTSTASVSVALAVKQKYKYMRSAGVTSLNFTLTTPPDSTVNAYWYIKFRSGSTPTNVSWPTGLSFPTDDGMSPDIDANTIYEIMIDEDKCMSFLTYKS